MVTDLSQRIYRTSSADTAKEADKVLCRTRGRCDLVKMWLGQALDKVSQLFYAFKLEKARAAASSVASISASPWAVDKKPASNCEGAT